MNLVGVEDDEEEAMINLDPSTEFDRVDDQYLVSVLQADRFKSHFCKWIRLHVSLPRAVIQVNGKRSSGDTGERGTVTVGYSGLSAVDPNLRFDTGASPVPAMGQGMQSVPMRNLCPWWSLSQSFRVRRYCIQFHIVL